MIMTAMNLVNPFWWVYKIVTFPARAVSGIFKAFRWGWNRESVWQKYAFTALAVWTAIPGTWAWTFYEAAKIAGYEEEAEFVANVVVTVAKAAWTAGTMAYNVLT